MKKVKKFFKKLNNRGSSIVMVVVSLAFIGIIVGALLAAASYAYRLKLQDLNSRDNFYYVEQAMNEIYAGVGSETVANMQDAYTYTVENMARYDINTKTYTNISQDEAQDMFAKRFIHNVQNNSFFKSSDDVLGDKIESFISNSSVVLDRSRLTKEVRTKNGEITAIVIKNVTVSRTVDYKHSRANGAFTQSITTDIVIGEPDFSVLFDASNNSDANVFDYSLVSDMGIEIRQNVALSIAGNIYAAADYYNKLYNYDDTKNDDAFTPSTPIKTKIKNASGEEIEVDKYKHVAVSSRKYSPTASLDGTEYSYTDTEAIPNDNVSRGSDTVQYYSFDGGANIKKSSDSTTQVRSKYSGLFIDGTDVSVLADYVIVPGTIAVMNKGSFSAFGHSGVATSETEIWTDNIILDGLSAKRTYEDNNVSKNKYYGPSAIIRGKLFVKDDTELNAAGSTLELRGSYYGYGDSTSKDSRVFLPQIADYFRIQDGVDANKNPIYVNRGHYNSSAIVVNGEQSALDLSAAKNLYIAGRSYVELSKYRATKASRNTSATYLDGNKTVTGVFPSETNVYTYQTETDDSTPENKKYTRDYKTGESISVKSNQRAYVPVQVADTTPKVYSKTINGKEYEYTGLEVTVNFGNLAMSSGFTNGDLITTSFFSKYFPSGMFSGTEIRENQQVTVYRVPVIAQKLNGKTVYFYDFDKAYEMLSAWNPNVALDASGNKVRFATYYKSAQYFESAYIEDYTAFLNKTTYTDDEKTLKSYLTDVTEYEDFEVEEVSIPNDSVLDPKDKRFVYSSGALTSTDSKDFEIENYDDENSLNSLSALMTNEGYKSGIEVKTSDLGAWGSGPLTLYQLSNNLEMEYNFMKWNLGHFKDSASDKKEKSYIKEFVSSPEYGEASITPINRFINVEAIPKDDSVDISISPADPSTVEANKTADHMLPLDSGYSVWVDDGRTKGDDGVSKIKIEARPKDNHVVRGIIVTKGDVVFDESVTTFEGLIISGGKIVIDERVQQITASPEICKTILRECMVSRDADAQALLKIFKGYENLANQAIDDEATGTDAKKIQNIDYSDVVSFDNWMKNVD